MKLTKSLEKYLYLTYKLSLDSKIIAAKALKEGMNVNSASTLDAIKALCKHGYIKYKPYKGIKITESGVQYAKEIENKKNLIKKFLVSFLLFDSQNADKITEELEYHVEKMLYERIESFLDYKSFCPCNSPKWIEGFESYLKNGEMIDKCAKCIENAMNNGTKAQCQGCIF